MKKLLLLLPLLIIIYACDTGAGGGKKVDLNSVEDSMYYAFGMSIVKGSGIEGVNWDASAFEKGINEAAAGEATLDPNAALQQIQGFGQEMQARQGRPVTAEDPLAANMTEVSYAYGSYLAKQLADIEMEVKPDVISGGFANASAGTEVLTDDAKLSQLMAQFNQMAQTQGRAVQDRKSQAEAGPNKEAGAAFMAENKNNEGVQTHESGMQYKSLQKGPAGGVSPTVADKVSIHYEGRLLDGTVFDSSYKRGEKANFPLSNLVKGWQIALPMMKPGDKWTIWLPSDLAYGNAGSPPNIPPGATLEFDIEYFGIGE
jgi:FKBP-type peptidyl-prolyl cis-trans isomerase